MRNLLLAGLLLLLLSRSQAPVRRACAEAVQTGGFDPVKWIGSRWAVTVHDLMQRGVEPRAAEIGARALVAQWAHETDAGRSEYNFNLGGWIAARGEPCHVLTDATSGRETAWAAFPSLADSVHEHIDRLQRRFPSAFRLLVSSPLDDGWIRELGRRGYYEANRDEYAAAWRARLGRVDEVLSRVAA